MLFLCLTILLGSSGEIFKRSLEYFKKLHGEDEILLSGDNYSEKAFEMLKLKDLIDNIREGGQKYYRFYPLLSKHPEHIKDFDYNWLRERKASMPLGEFFQVLNQKSTRRAQTIQEFIILQLF